MIAISEKQKSAVWKIAFNSNFFNYGKYNFRKNIYGKKTLKMAFNSLWKRPLLWRKSCSVAIVIEIYVVIGAFSWKYLKWLAQEIIRLQVSGYRCPVTANCPIIYTVQFYNFAD